MNKKQRKVNYSQIAKLLNSCENKKAYDLVASMAADDNLFILSEYKGEQSKLVEQRDELLEALEKAKQFIENGIELGYIRMPDADTPDSAHQSLPIINAAIAKAKG